MLLGISTYQKSQENASAGLKMRLDCEALFSVQIWMQRTKKADPIRPAFVVWWCWLKSHGNKEAAS